MDIAFFIYHLKKVLKNPKKLIIKNYSIFYLTTPKSQLLVIAYYKK